METSIRTANSPPRRAIRLVSTLPPNSSSSPVTSSTIPIRSGPVRVRTKFVGMGSDPIKDGSRHEAVVILLTPARQTRQHLAKLAANKAISGEFVSLAALESVTPRQVPHPRLGRLPTCPGDSPALRPSLTIPDPTQRPLSIHPATSFSG